MKTLDDVELLDVVEIFVQRQDVLGILQQYYRLRRNLVGRLSLFGCVELDVLLAVEVSVVVQKSATQLVAQHVLHSALEGLGLHQPFVERFLQVLVVGAEGEVDVVAGIDGQRCLLFRIEGLKS